MFDEPKTRRVTRHRPKAALIAILFFLGAAAALLAQARADALAEYKRASYASAIEICKAEIAENTNNLEAHVILCWSLLKLGRYAECAVYADDAAKLARYDVRVIEILGEVDYFQGRNAQALQRFQEYVNIAPEGQRIDTVYYYIGEIYIRLGRFRHADIAISTALHYVPGNAAWWTRLAYAKEMAGERHEAVRAYSRALELNPNLNDAARGVERNRAALESR